LAFFSKTKCNDQILAEVWAKNANFFTKFFGENIFKILASVPEVLGK
jgi:hypothetical protein